MGKILDFEPRQRMDNHANWDQINYTPHIPSLPILPETLLAIELITAEPYVNLGDLSDLLRKDIGAVARIFHSAVREREGSGSHSTRLEDCISSLGSRKCLEVLACATVAWVSARTVVSITWRHSERVAEVCRRVVIESNSDLNSDDAYMVGLFHALVDLPVSLHWNSTPVQYDDRVGLAMQLAEEWGLPSAVIEYFREIQSVDAPSIWSAIVDRAHEMVG